MAWIIGMETFFNKKPFLPTKLDDNNKTEYKVITYILHWISDKVEISWLVWENTTTYNIGLVKLV